MASKKKWVAFRGNATIPASVLGKRDDLRIQAGEAVQVPEGYADHVVQDGFADYSDASAKAASKKPGAVDEAVKKKIQQFEEDLEAANGEIAALNKDLQESLDEAQGLQSDLAEKTEALKLSDGLLRQVELEAAQTAVTDAQTALDVAESGTDAAESAQATLRDAQETLAALSE